MITKRYNKPGTGEKGFTLIEILTAILIIIVGLLAVGSLQLTAISGNSSANKESGAMAKAGEKLEKLIAKSDLVSNSTPETVQDGIYKITTLISDGDNAELVDIIVTVAWADGSRTRTRELKYTKIR